MSFDQISNGKPNATIYSPGKYEEKKKTKKSKRSPLRLGEGKANIRALKGV